MRNNADIAVLVGLLALVGPAPAIAAGPAARPEHYAGWSLLEVDVDSPAALAQLLALGVDPWTEHPRPGPVRVLVSPAQRTAIAATDWAVRTVVEDVELELDDERTRLLLREPLQHGVDFFADYRELEEIDAQLDATVAAHPELASIVALGDSLEGRSIRGIRIAAAGAADRPTLLVTAGQHAREWIAVSSAVYIAEQLIARADEPEIATALAELQFVIVPVVNPDGYAYTWSDERLWRKNRRDGIGVDINRNFGHGWGGEGAGANPWEENYRGSAAFSEPETVAVRDFVLAHPELVGHLDMHSYGELVLYPWGDVYEPAPDDVELSAIANAAATAMATSGRSYAALQSSFLYPAAGNISDWTYGEADLRAMAFELRPSGEFEGNGFVIGADQIVPVGEEALAGFWALVQWALPDEPDPTTGGESSSTGDDTSSSSTSVGSTGDDLGSDDTTGLGTSSTTLAQGSSSTDAESSTSLAPAEDEGGGCGCSQRGHRSGVIAMLAITLLGRRRRRA